MLRFLVTGWLLLVISLCHEIRKAHNESLNLKGHGYIIVYSHIFLIVKYHRNIKGVMLDMFQYATTAYHFSLL